MEGAGNSNTLLNYRYTDKQPLKGRSYYRLKQNDFNGNFTYSEIKGVLTKTINNHSLSIRPNPVSRSEALQIEYQIPDSEAAQLSIISMQGIIMHTEKVKSNGKVLSLEIGHLSQGVYLVIMQSEGGIKLTERVIITQ